MRFSKICNGAQGHFFKWLPILKPLKYHEISLQRILAQKIDFAQFNEKNDLST